MTTPAPPPDRYFVLGHPVAHSRSPFIHAAFARQTGQRLVYERRLCPLDGFAAAVRALAADRDGGRVRGCNVTVPFKFEAGALARTQTPRAALARAANVLCFDPDGWLADNTDGIGLVRDVEFNAGLALAGRRVLVIGAGGAGAGVLGPLIEGRPAQLQLVNRTPDRARALVERHRAWAAQHGVDLSAASLDDAGEAFDLVLNASASSLAGGAVPVDGRVLRPGTLAVDLMYGSAAQGFLDWAAAHGARGRDGLGMLVEQAAEAFLLWRGVRPQTAPVLAALRAQLQAEAGAAPR
jgi:shikimate dehydrogenase